MKPCRRTLSVAAVLALCVTVASAGRADEGAESAKGPNRYVVTNLTADLPGIAPNTDPVLQNAWGVAFTPGASPFWIADNATGCSTLYDGSGVPQPPMPLKVKLPLPGGTIPDVACQPANPENPPTPAPATPTGLVWNPSATFLVPKTTSPASFIFATEDGTIAAWSGGLTPTDQAVLAVDNSPDAVYKGLVVGTNVHGVFLFATNFHAGTIDVFAPKPPTSMGTGTGFRPATSTEIDGDFTDPHLPAGFAPFGIQNINGDLFVTYAKQDEDQRDDVAGPGHGFVNVFNTNGHLLRRFASQEPLNSPWGVARASFAFGRFSGAILIGNFGNGHINAFNTEGDFLGPLRDVQDKPLVIDGLWALTLGGGRNSGPDTLYFTAGPNDETHGLFGTITPASQHE
jgi:uncharacterized protein (TIGR03118 family)